MTYELSAPALEDISTRMGAMPEQTARAMRRAINRTLAAVRSRFSREIAARAGLSYAAYAKHRTVTVRAHRGAGGDELRAKFWAGFKEISLAHFKNTAAPSGVTATGKGKKLSIPHGFMLKKFGGNVFVGTKWLNQMPAAVVPHDKQFWPLAKPSERQPSPAARMPMRSPKSASPVAADARRAREKVRRQRAGGPARLAFRFASTSTPESFLNLARAFAAERLEREFEHELRYEISRE